MSSNKFRPCTFKDENNDQVRFAYAPVSNRLVATVRPQTGGATPISNAYMTPIQARILRDRLNEWLGSEQDGVNTFGPNGEPLRG